MDHFIDVLNSINDNYISKPRQEFLLLIKKKLRCNRQRQS